tara:strand:- start:1337 stop:2041 length:705 start_codon:yes stop_codon:yes gene_type:complete
MDVAGKNILITGGSLGIGKETAKILVSKGANVIITGRDEQRLLKAKDFSGAYPLVFDISDVDSLSHNVKKCMDYFEGKIDVLINNAGIGFFSQMDDVKYSDFKNVFDVNVFGLALLTQEIIPFMKSQNSGTIINIGSSASLKGFKSGSVYAASKFAVRALTQCWQAELRPYSIRVCQLNPSEVKTAFNDPDRVERSLVDNKLRPSEISHAIISVLEMDDRGFVNELNVWATNPF